MNVYDDNIWELITKDLSEEATPEDKKALRRWLEEDPDHYSFYLEIKRNWEDGTEDISITEDTSYLFDYENGLNLLRQKIKEEENKVPKHFPSPVNSRGMSAWKIAASIVLLVISVSAYMATQYWIPPKVSYATTQIEQRIVTLPDGSKVRLNRNSKLSFPKDLTGKLREVTLEGEAFFDVAENPDRPFIIHMDDVVVRVLGTSFIVKDLGKNEKNRMMVAVKEGVVSLRQRTMQEHKAVELEAGQLGLIPQGENAVKVEQGNIENYMSWMNGHLAFDDVPFNQAIRQLERIYGIECELQDSSIGTLRLTVYTERIQKDEVLQAIALALNLTYQEQSGKILWMKKSN